MPKEAMLALPQEGSTVEEISIGTHARTITPLAKCMIGFATRTDYVRYDIELSM
jgi:hypothetical protein